MTVSALSIPIGMRPSQELAAVTKPSHTPPTSLDGTWMLRNLLPVAVFPIMLGVTLLAIKEIKLRSEMPSAKPVSQMVHKTAVLRR